MKKFLQQKPLSSLSERIKKTPKDNSSRGHWTEKEVFPLTYQQKIKQKYLMFYNAII